MGAFKDGDLNVLYTNGWDTKAFLLMAQQNLLLARGLSPGAVGVIMSLKQGETIFLVLLLMGKLPCMGNRLDLPKRS